jgi:hypothetical protein
MQKEKLKLIYEKYGLEASMFFKHQHYTIVTREGIEKIQQAESIRISYDIIEGNTQEGIVTLHAKGYRAEEPDYVVETFGEVNPKNNRNAYPWAMAEKRALSRVVLKLSGLYSEGVFGEDESDSFKRSTL